ncbi:Subtilisin-like protease, fibronectin type-III domain [Dillenia turbinata]|uniref:Subtilisin-like protease, fibronectin type-III domain n=1 Tax=Dillenia turbinata TaxID=194707 RepID=A0AAN8VPQ4_9MAGN
MRKCRYCFNNSLDPKLVESKIVVCDMLASGRGAFYAGAASTIMQDSGDRSCFLLPTPCSIPLSSQHEALATILKSYQANDKRLLSTMKARSINDAEIGFASSHINPVKAIDPSLVYDACEVDYIAFLCGQGYNDPIIELVTGNNRLKIQVNPSVLSFVTLGQQLSFILMIQGETKAAAMRASLVWDDGIKHARSTIVVYI